MPEGLEHGRHAAFVCCSEKDRKSAGRLCRRLGDFPIARELIGQETPMGVVPARLGPLFLSPVAADAGTTIPAATRQALEGADALLLLASPDSASSLRVNEEVRLFRHLYPDRPVIPLILASATAPTGRPLFPPALRFELNADGRVSQVPGPTLVAADERKNGDGPELAHAKVVARLLGVETETIHATHRARRRRARILTLAAAAVVALSLSGGYAGLLVWREARLHAEVARQQAETARRAAHLETVLEGLRPPSPYGIGKEGGMAREGYILEDTGMFAEAASVIAANARTDPRYARAASLLESGKPLDAAVILNAAALEATAALAPAVPATPATSPPAVSPPSGASPAGTPPANTSATDKPPTDKPALGAPREPGNRAASRKVARYWRTVGAVAAVADPAQAREAYAAAIRLDPVNPEGQYRHALLEAAAGDHAKAEAAWREVLRLTPAGNDTAGGRTPDGTDARAEDEKRWRARLGLGDAAFARAAADAALTEYQQARAIAEARVKAELAKPASATPEPGKPDTPVTRWRARLAGTLDRIGLSHTKLGKLPEAETAFRAALDIRESEAKAAENDAGWKHALAVSHNHLGAVLAARGNRAEALKSWRAANAIVLDLAKADPKNPAIQEELASSWDTLGDAQIAAKAVPEAVKSYNESLAIRTALASAEPAGAARQRDLAFSNQRVGDHLLSFGNGGEALKYHRAALAIWERLAKTEPETTEWQVAQAGGNERIGDVLSGQGKLAEALKAYAVAAPIRRQLVKTEPKNPAAQRALAAISVRMGVTLAGLGMPKEAVRSYREALPALAAAAAVEPDALPPRRDMAQTFGRIGELLMASGSPAEALKAFRDSLTALDRVAKLTQGGVQTADMGAQRDLGAAYARTGDALLTLGDTAEALKSYRAGLALLERPGRGETGGSRRELAVLHGKIGDVLLAQQKPADALTYYREQRMVLEKLAQAAPRDPGPQHDLALADQAIGGALAAQRNPAEALKSYQSAHATFERLAKAAPNNQAAQRELAVSWSNLASAHGASGAPAEGLNALKKGQAVMANLVRLAPENAEWKLALSRFNEQIAAAPR